MINIATKLPAIISILLAPSYDNYASYYDKLNGSGFSNSIGIEKLRVDASKYVQGDVLEVAVGTGLQNIYFNWNQINKYVGVDFSQNMLKEAETRYKELFPNDNKASYQQMDAKKLDFNDNTFDAVIDTFSLCVIDNPTEAIQQMKRVVKPTGNIILLENTLSNNPLLATFQHVTEPIITPLAKECKWDINIEKLSQQNGLQLISPIERINGGTMSLGIYRKTIE